MIGRIRNLFNNIQKSKLKKNMAISVLYKPVGMMISLIYTPILLHYLGDEAYGVWGTILSVINWINYFDIGIGKGLRNTVAEGIEKKQYDDVSKITTTAYKILAIIAIIIFSIGTLAVFSFDFNKIFNTKIVVKPALWISLLFISINFVLSLCKEQLYALEEAGKVSLMSVLTQLLNLIGIAFLSLFSRSKIVYVALIVGITPLLIGGIASSLIWKRFSFLRPQIKGFDKRSLKGIGGLGVKFFIIQISALILYTTDNLIISNLFGASAVTPYVTAYTAFSAIIGLFSALLSPLWSRYTVAMVRGEWGWIESSIVKLNKLLFPMGIALLIGSFAYKPISEIWLQKRLVFDSGMILSMAIYTFLQIWSNIYATVMNGLGRVDFQLVLAVSAAILNIPLSIFLGNTCGLHTTGVLLATIICMLLTNIPITIYVHRFIRKKRIDNKN